MPPRMHRHLVLVFLGLDAAACASAPQTMPGDSGGPPAASGTFALDEHNGGTTVTVLGEPLSGERQEAWTQVADAVLGGLEHSVAVYVETMERLARGESL